MRRHGKGVNKMVKKTNEISVRKKKNKFIIKLQTGIEHSRQVPFCSFKDALISNAWWAHLDVGEQHDIKVVIHLSIQQHLEPRYNQMILLKGSNRRLLIFHLDFVIIFNLNQSYIPMLYCYHRIHANISISQLINKIKMKNWKL